MVGLSLNPAVNLYLGGAVLPAVAFATTAMHGLLVGLSLNPAATSTSAARCCCSC